MTTNAAAAPRPICSSRCPAGASSHTTAAQAMPSVSAGIQRSDNGIPPASSPGCGFQRAHTVAVATSAASSATAAPSQGAAGAIHPQSPQSTIVCPYRTSANTRKY